MRVIDPRSTIDSEDTPRATQLLGNGRSKPKSVVQCSAGAGGRLHAGFQAHFAQSHRAEKGRTETESEPRRLWTE